MSDFVLRTPRPQHSEHTIYYRFDTQKTESQKQTSKRPLEKQNTNQDQDIETKAKKKKQDSETKPKTTTSTKKKTPATKTQKVTKHTFI